MKKVMINGEEWSEIEGLKDFLDFPLGVIGPNVERLHLWREKEKPMPEIRAGDLVILPECFSPKERAVAKVDDNLVFFWVGTSLYNFIMDCHIRAIYRDGKEIWRKK